MVRRFRSLGSARTRAETVGNRSARSPV
jgi:hypothetical protein